MDCNVPNCQDHIPEPPSPSSSSPNQHLSFPTAEPTPEHPPVAPDKPRQVLKDRLYIGNLHPTVDEYTLLQIFSKFGRVTKLDFLFHKAGALKGKPRGYAFVEYGNNDEALKALSAAHDKLLRGRKLVVTFAHQAPPDQGSGPSIYGGVLPKRKGMMEVGRPTTLSLLKTGIAGRNDGTQNKIAMMEAKLRQMESTKPKSSPKANSSDVDPTASIPTSQHPSLPMKPPPIIPKGHQPTIPYQSKNPPPSKTQQPLPSLPILPSRTSKPDSKALPIKQAKASKLAGVKIIGKPKEKHLPPEGG